MEVEQLKCVERKNRSPAVASSEGEIVEFYSTLTSKREILGFIRRYVTCNICEN